MGALSAGWLFLAAIWIVSGILGDEKGGLSKRGLKFYLAFVCAVLAAETWSHSP